MRGVVAEIPLPRRGSTRCKVERVRRTLGLLAVLAAISALALALTAGAASAAPHDVKETSTFVKANYTLGRTARSRVKLAEDSITAYVKGIAAQCPNAALGSPGNSKAEQLSNEVVVILNVLVYHANAAAIAKLAQAVKPLHWSNPKVTSTVRRYVGRLEAFATMPVPDLCADVKAWAATAFKTVPADTVEVDKRYNVIEEAPAHISKTLLAPYLTGTVAHTFKLTQRLEGQLLELENNEGAVYWAQILEALSMNP